MTDIASAKATKPWLDFAIQEENKQVAATGSNARILEYLTTCHDLTKAELATDSTAWCAAFANWCMIQSGLEGTGTSWARDWFDWGVPDLQPSAGSIVVWKRMPEGEQESIYGHITFLIEDRGDELLVLGGNQTNRVCRMPYPREGEMRGDFYADIAFRKPR